MLIGEVDKERFKKLCVPSNRTDCINWIGTIDEDSYGKFYLSLERKQTAAHRVAYILHTGEDIKGIVIRHTCDNPTCVNPLHLIKGTNLDNVNDAIKRGLRHTKLSKAEVEEILSLKGKLTGAKIAIKFNVSRQTISHILTGQTWSKLELIETEDVLMTKIKKLA